MRVPRRLLVSATSFAGVVLLAATFVGCDPVEPDPPPPPPPQIQEWEGPRRMAFERVPDLDNGAVLDLHLAEPGLGIAVTQHSASVRKLWAYDGSEWRVFGPSGLNATCACVEPGGERVLVGLRGASYVILDRTGAVLHGPARFNVGGEGNEVDDWATSQCRWMPTVGGYVFATLASEDQLEGALLYLDVDRIASSASWFRPRVRIQRPNSEQTEEHDMAFDGLSVYRQSGFGISVTVGVSFGPYTSNATQMTLSGQPDGGLSTGQWHSFGVVPEYPEAAAYGRPRVFGNVPGRGLATLYRRGEAWRIIVNAPPGYRGQPVLEAPELRGTALAVAADPTGTLWVGGEGGLGLWRSTERLIDPAPADP